jgi:hypothetical protein
MRYKLVYEWTFMRYNTILCIELYEIKYLIVHEVVGVQILH